MNLEGLNPEFAARLQNLVAEAKKEGYQIGLKSGLRSDAEQKALYDRAVQKHGKGSARKYAAPPGRSPHNVGFAGDLTYATPAARKWAADNAKRLGLQFRLPHEPWHVEPQGYEPSWVNSPPEFMPPVPSVPTAAPMGDAVTNQARSGMDAPQGDLTEDKQQSIAELLRQNPNQSWPGPSPLSEMPMGPEAPGFGPMESGATPAAYPNQPNEGSRPVHVRYGPTGAPIYTFGPPPQGAAPTQPNAQPVPSGPQPPPQMAQQAASPTPPGGGIGNGVSKFLEGLQGVFQPPPQDVGVGRLNPMSTFGYGMSQALAGERATNPALAGFSAMHEEQARQQKYNREVQALQSRMGAGVDPSVVRQIKYHMSMGDSYEVAARRAAPSGSLYGTTMESIAGVPTRQTTTPGGQRSQVFLPRGGQPRGAAGQPQGAAGQPQGAAGDLGSQDEYETRLGSQERVKGSEGGFGRMKPEFMSELYKQRNGLSNAAGRANRLLEKFKAGDYDNLTGPLRGHVTGWFSSEVAELDMQAVLTALQNLQITNLAPVSNYEIQLMEKLYASKFRNKDQNIAILNEVTRSLASKQALIQKRMEALRDGATMEDLLLAPLEDTFQYGYDLNKKGELVPVGSAPRQAADRGKESRVAPGQRNTTLESFQNQLDRIGQEYQ